MRGLWVLAAAASFAGAAAVGQGGSSRASTAVAQAIGASLGANAAEALARLNAVPPGEFDGNDAAFRACMNARFTAQPATDPAPQVADRFAADVLATFHAYWREALLDPQDRDRAEARLLQGLQRHLGQRDATDLDALEPLLKQRLAASGYHALLGVTQPLRELMLWRTQQERSYRVELPDGAYTTRVMVLRDFAVHGWADFATCGRRGAGGWTTKDALYIVGSRYQNLDDEEFRVSFLAHETQHFADIARFSAMESWELEYRAKLVELSLAHATRDKVLQKFAEDQGDEKSSPHSYANKRVLAAMRAKLGLAGDADLAVVGIDRLQAAAREALREDTKRRSS